MISTLLGRETTTLTRASSRSFSTHSPPLLSLRAGGEGGLARSSKWNGSHEPGRNDGGMIEDERDR